jgi:hypothetical protein
MLLGREPHLLSFVRVLAVYLTSAFLAILAVLSARRMNNLRVSIKLDGSIPIVPTYPSIGGSGACFPFPPIDVKSRKNYVEIVNGRQK